MAKGNLFLGEGVGRLGSVVLYRQRGQQLARSYATHVSNPRTWRQAVSRCLLATATASYSALYRVSNGAYQGYAPGSESLRRHVALNYAMLRARVQSVIEDGRDAVLECATGNYMKRGDLVCPGFSFIISDGSLPALEYECDNDCAMLYVNAEGAAVTYRSFLDALGLERGACLDVVFMLSSSGNDLSTLLVRRIVLEPADGNLDGALLDNDMFRSPNPANDVVYAKFAEYLGGYQLYFSIKENVASMENFNGCAFVARAAGKVSPQRLYVAFNPDSHPFGAAVWSYMEDSRAVCGNAYLDGGDGI